MHFASIVSFIGLIGSAFAGQFLENQPFDGPNPSNVKFNIYVPNQVKPNGPVLVMAHYCGGTGRAVYQSSGFAAIADQYGFPVIFPTAPNSCWDVGSAATLKHNGGGDSYGIVNMVKYVIKKYNSDASRVYITGHSSGGMMTQVLAGAYPDVFAAAAEQSGVPFGCWANGGVAQWNSQCAQGQISKTGAQWAQLVKNAYPGYTGKYPKIQLYHGAIDTTINFNNWKEGIKEWTAVHGISETPTSTQQNTPMSQWTKTVYGNGEVEAYTAANAGHEISYQSGLIAKFFNLAGAPTSAPQTAAPTTAAPATTAPATTAPASTAPATTAPATTKPVTTPTATTKTPVPSTTTPAPTATSTPLPTSTNATQPVPTTTPKRCTIKRPATL